MNNAELGYILDSEYGIMTRTGLHCAPLAHKTIGTFPEGTLRFSFGPFNDIKDVNYALNSLHNILERK
jgi:selenocysteine lyase/cysteine desulfurase